MPGKTTKKPRKKSTTLEEKKKAAETWLVANEGIFRKLTPKQKKFLNAFPTNLTINATCRRTGIDKRTHFYAMQKSPGYAQCFEALKEYVVLAMEDEAVRRATKGITEDVFYQGTKCGTKKVYSDGLLMFMLKAARPDVYRERVTMDTTTTMTTDGPSEYSGLSKEALMQMREIAEKDLARNKTIEAA